MPGRKFADEAVKRLQARVWPGNIRELRNAVERALILASGKTVTAADIDQLLPGDPGRRRRGWQPYLRDVQAGSGEKIPAPISCKEHDWNVSETARALKMPRSNLYKKIERYGLSRETSL